MEKANEIFFSEHGLTSTSASHLADLAQEVIAGNEAKLKNMTFVTSKVDIVGQASESGKNVCVGYDENMLNQVRPILEEIASMNAFCAWMREAVKAKDKELEQVVNLTFEDWCTFQEGVSFYRAEWYYIFCCEQQDTAKDESDLSYSDEFLHIL